MIITLGFTESDRARDHSSFADGYRIGARQISVTIALKGDGSHLSTRQWADAVFEASNLPAPSGDPVVAAIQHALADQVHTPLRSMSVGDIIEIQSGATTQWLACHPRGWRPVTEPVNRGGLPPLLYSGWSFAEQCRRLVNSKAYRSAS